MPEDITLQDELRRGLRARIDALMPVDRQRLLRSWHHHADPRRSGSTSERELLTLGVAVEAAEHRVRERAAGVPARIIYPAELPISQRREEIKALIQNHQVLVLCGETGSGKTTQIPKMCLELGRGVRGQIGHTQPRRLAARAVASRIAEELDVRMGDVVGFKVRFGDETSPRTLIKLMTDGILLAETQHDRLLLQYDTLIIDEAHERSLNIDFMLGYVRTILPRRPDLKVIVTSATIDPERFAANFPDAAGKPAPIMMVSGRTYPVEVRYRPPAIEDWDERDEEFHNHVLACVQELAACGPGDILMFFSGEREIREMAKVLEERRHSCDVDEVVPLFARLTAQEQARVFQPHRGRRVVLATNVAETSLTVPGIRYVLDPGLARINRYSPKTKVQRLEVESISRASADQRAGRCGRLGPGVCIRMYREDDYAKRTHFTDPEIMRDNLASVILQMEALQLGHVEEFPFIDTPDRRAVRDGYETLHELGAIDDAQKLTSMGRDLARLPIDPRIGRMLLASGAERCVREMLVLASALSIQDPRERPLAAQDLADAAHLQFDDPSSDFLGYLKLWQAWQERKRQYSSSKQRAWCKANYLSYLRLREWEDVHGQLCEMAESLRLTPRREAAPPERIHRALLTGMLCNIGVKAQTDRELGAYIGGRNNRFNIFPGSCLFQKGPPWLMAADVVRTTKMYARTVAPVDPAWIEELGAHLLKRTYSEPRWDQQSGRVVANVRITIFGIELVAKRRVHFGEIDPPAAREIFIHHALVLGEMETKAPFLAHNLGLEDQLREWEVRSRRANLVADVERRFAFYAARVPKDIVTTKAFERWLYDASKVNPRVLHMSPEDVIAGSAEVPTSELFPDELDLGKVRLPIAYRFETGHDADGVTLRVPLDVLGQVPAERMPWLVPGHVQEKIDTILRGVGKDYRRVLPPTSQLVAAVLPMMRATRGDQNFLDALRSCVRESTSIDVPREVLAGVTLPIWMAMRIEVVDAHDGRVLGAGRDIHQLKAMLAPQIKHGMLTSPNRFNRDAITQWDFGDLPERVELDRGGVIFGAFPGIADQTRESGKPCVGLRLYDTFESAQAATRMGSRRLFMLAAKEELRRHTQYIPGIESASVQFTPLGSPAFFREQVQELIADRAFLGEMLPVRTEKEFAFRVSRGIERLSAAVHEVSPLITQTMAMYQDVARILAQTHPALYAESLNDIRDQLGELVPRDFLATKPFAWLRHYPRYLQGIRVRMQRLAGSGVERDKKAMRDVQPYVKGVADLLANQKALGLDPAAIDEFRWLVQELRVQQFAQELRTAVPVSPKRLTELWHEIVKT
jgi:ATP-dependent helicase HrpA